MKMILSERNLVVVLFILVLITFSFAHEDSKKMEKVYIGVSSSASSNLVMLNNPLQQENQSFIRENPATDPAE